MDDVPIAGLRQSRNVAMDSKTGQPPLLYVVGQLGLGGLERQLYYLLANLDHARYQASVLVWNFNPSDKYLLNIEALKIPVYGFPIEWSPLCKLRAFRVLARRVAPEIIHSYSFHTNFAAYYAAWGTKAVALGSLRGDFARAREEGGAIRGALNARWPSVHISNSVASAKSACPNSGPFSPRQIFVVRNGLDLGQFSCSNLRPGTKSYIAAVGSLLPVKRWDRLLRAVKEVETRIGKIQLRIAGDGPLRSELEKLARELGLSNTVTFLGAVDDIPEFLKKAKFLVHTSESEGCPNVVMEAMACGLPVVTMKAGDIPYLVEEGLTGFVVPQNDENALADRIRLLLNDGEFCCRMGQAARVKAEHEFSLDRLVAETLNAYRAAGWNDGLPLEPRVMDPRRREWRPIV